MFEKDLGKDRVIKRKGRTISHGMCAIEGIYRKADNSPRTLKLLLTASLCAENG